MTDYKDWSYESLGDYLIEVEYEILIANRNRESQTAMAYSEVWNDVSDTIFVRDVERRKEKYSGAASECIECGLTLVTNGYGICEPCVEFYYGDPNE